MIANGKQNAFVFYVNVLAYVLAALVLRVAALSPLACALLMEGGVRWLALLCPVVWIFVLLPLRASFANAMTAVPGRFDWRSAFCLRHYGAKLGSQLLHVLKGLAWGIPLAGLMVAAGYAYTEVDALTLFQSVNELGNLCAEWLQLNTFNNFMVGVSVVAAVYGLAVLIWAWGVARLSVRRYLRACALRDGVEPRQMIRRGLRGRRIRQLGCMLINLLLWIPFLYVMGDAVMTTVSDLSTLLMMAITTGSLPAMDLAGAVVPVVVAFGGLYLPLLPIRRWITAAFANRCSNEMARKVSA